MCTSQNRPVVNRARLEHPPCLYLHYSMGWEGKVCVCSVGTGHSQTRPCDVIKIAVATQSRLRGCTN